ncbi:HKD family nuclease [Alkalibacterium putridalgicola]|uniref:phospholipase D n=1 Tax=Alkalibacterium putridalgicola TaxID=426703 RepID=A0A1H7TW01_9LACT|nr:phospholipase D family protein [Alkalibacterium putridalgicola]GEK88599.1 phospholipase D [Alkalibacterium putridalgicola]SEL88658.1 HKD family nuclease [Alkalibacterium putridalgicola]
MPIKQSDPHKKKAVISVLLILLFLVPMLVSLYHYFKPVPEGLSTKGTIHKTNDLEFLYDLTYENEAGEVIHEQQIFDRVYRMIDEAEDFIVLDMFLFNDDYDHTAPDLNFPQLSTELSDALIEKKQTEPDVEIVFITDPINTFYGTYMPEHIAQMTDAGISMVFTDLSPLRDSNPVYSGFSRTYLDWFDRSGTRYLPNILRPQGPEVAVPSYTKLLHFKANHRKTLMTEREGLITSANPHDASAYHSNIAYVLKGDILKDLLASEKAVAELSGFDTTLFESFKVQNKSSESGDAYSVQLLTEKKIKVSLLESISQADENDAIKIGMFYLSDRDIIDALLEADKRDVSIQMVLDINQDAFGNKKIGIPNRPVADELTKGDSTIAVRWYKSHGEQFHSKFYIHETKTEVTMIGGSTNFTRRNLDDYNLETNVKITGTKDQPEIEDMLQYFDRIWNNEGGTYTVDYAEHAEATAWKDWLYHIQEFTGLSTF